MKQKSFSGVKKCLCILLTVVTFLALLCNCGRQADVPPTSSEAPSEITTTNTQPSEQTQPTTTVTPEETQPATTAPLEETQPTTTEPVEPTTAPPPVEETEPIIPEETQPVTTQPPQQEETPAIQDPPSADEELTSLQIYNAEPTSLSTYSATLTIDKGDSFHLAIVRGSTTANVQWNMSQSNIVEIHGTTVTCLTDGSVTLTTTHNGRSYRCDIVVLEPLISVPADPLQIVDDAYALSPGQTLPYQVTLTGRIVEVNDSYNSEFENITVTIAISGREDKPIKCYRLTGDDAHRLALGGIITVTGTIGSRPTFQNEFEIRFDAGCELLVYDCA